MPLPSPSPAGITAYRNLSGLYLGKMLTLLTRWSGKGGTTLPGRAAMTLAPDLLPLLSAQTRRGNIVITGSNGKTTTAELLSGILRRAGKRVVHNRSGANLAWGVASAYINASSWRGLLEADFGLMEADEGAFATVVRQVQPRGIIVTNIYPDQLDRYGEVEQIRRLIQEGLHHLPPGGVAILNADDPLVAGLETGPGINTFFYGLSPTPGLMESNETLRDLVFCPQCGEQLVISRAYLAHLGRYRCRCCPFRTPEPRLQLIRWESAGNGLFRLYFSGDKGLFSVAFPLPGVYNLYNALAAAAGALAAGIPVPPLAAALEEGRPSAGRMETHMIKRRPVTMSLIKNAVGANQVLSTILKQESRLNLLLAINDRYADGTDISWLYDVDFERLMPAEHLKVTAGGLRAYDTAVRLKYAGIDPRLIKVVPDLREALSGALEGTGPSEKLYILPTYTAMLDLRRLINQPGYAEPNQEV